MLWELGFGLGLGLCRRVLGCSLYNYNQTIKFDQLIEHIMRKTFLEASYRKCGAETIPRLFSKKNKIEHISG